MDFCGRKSVAASFHNYLKLNHYFADARRTALNVPHPRGRER